MKNLGDLCGTVKLAAQEAQFAAVEGDRREFAAAVEKALAEARRLDRDYHQWLVTAGAPVSDSRASV